MENLWDFDFSEHPEAEVPSWAYLAWKTGWDFTKFVVFTDGNIANTPLHHGISACLYLLSITTKKHRRAWKLKVMEKREISSKYFICQVQFWFHLRKRFGFAFITNTNPKTYAFTTYIMHVHRVRFWENTAKNNKIKHVTLPRIKAFFLPKSLPKAANIFKGAYYRSFLVEQVTEEKALSE